MSYAKRDDVPVRAGEQAVELDDGDIVAISCSKTRDGSSLVLRAQARAVESDGGPVRDSSGAAVVCAHPHTATADSLATHGVDALVRDCLMLVLGEPTEILQPSQHVRRSACIRSALQAMRAEGDVDAGAVL